MVQLERFMFSVLYIVYIFEMTSFDKKNIDYVIWKLVLLQCFTSVYDTHLGDQGQNDIQP